MLAKNLALAAAIYLVAGIPPLMAQSVTPTRVELNIAESSQAILTLSSTRAVEVALELSINSYSSAHGDVQAPLEILPPQVLLRPGETRQVTVRWRGGETLRRSESYYLAIDELPLNVDAPEAATELQLLSSLRLPVHVETGGQAMLWFFSPGVDGSASLELRNAGRQYALLSHYEIGVENNSGIVVFDGLDIARLLNRDAILPGQTVSIPLRLIGLEAAGLQGARLVRKE
ncbi:P pilus assembly protein, chaperone PapD [Microbulbifer donghaiensis]|uniref:P pilus assembly protein, chaperone PapD n=1 Tax=Microbulbifer donghaiensis TaxID=494016 RepID=A0A1M5ECI4_9GAMM|nr:fimbria/pilus periplasmic chaperone [Microbulbifer donghaiensis]SHF76844.1 P pilus assembly protein, chaperone PapD [Microbulbifer donghaiensis]